MIIKAIESEKECASVYRDLKNKKLLEKLFYCEPDLSEEEFLSQMLQDDFLICFIAVKDGEPIAFSFFDRREYNFIRGHFAFFAPGFTGEQKGNVFKNMIIHILNKIPSLKGVWGIIPEYFTETIKFWEKYCTWAFQVGSMPGGFLMPDGKEYGGKIFYYSLGQEGL